VAIVTGASSGIGRAIAVELGRSGMHVAFCFLEDGAQELLADFDIRTAPYRRPAGRRSR
jgi:NAD(P)-dependent dehydrogenase (short-subunit alcohol dehydrogenase family)